MQFIQLLINYLHLINKFIFYLRLLIINLFLLLLILLHHVLLLSNYIILLQIPIVFLYANQLTDFILVVDQLLCLFNANLFLPELLLRFLRLMKFRELVKHSLQGIDIHQHVICLRFNEFGKLGKQGFALFIRDLLGC